MKLQDEIKNLLAEMAPAIPQETGMKIGAAIKKLQDSGLTGKSLRKGAGCRFLPCQISMGKQFRRSIFSNKDHW